MSNVMFADLSSDKSQLQATRMPIKVCSFMAKAPPGIHREGNPNKIAAKPPLEHHMVKSIAKSSDLLHVAPPPGLSLEGDDGEVPNKEYPPVGPPPGLSLECDDDKVLDAKPVTKEKDTQSGSESAVSTNADDKAASSSDETGDETRASEEEIVSGSAQEEEIVDESRKSRGSEAHERGECRPCAYFWTQSDSCRRGTDCGFCHLCDRDGMKKYKKEKRRRLKAQAAEELAAKEAKEAEDAAQKAEEAAQKAKETEEALKEGPKRVEIPNHTFATPLHASPMFNPMMPATLPFGPMPMMNPMLENLFPPMSPMLGMPPMPAPPPVPTHTRLSAQSKPYIPADVINSCSKAVMEAITIETGTATTQKASLDIARAVAAEVEKLVEVSFDVIAAEKTLARFKAEYDN